MSSSSEDENLHKITYSSCVTFLPDFKRAKCVKCYDGDTITLGVEFHGKNTRFSCRLVGIDTPEIRSKDISEKQLAQIARDFIRGILLHRIVNVIIHGVDKYGRLLVSVSTGTALSGTESGDISEHMISSGLAVRYSGKTKPDVDWSQMLAQWRSNQ